MHDKAVFMEQIIVNFWESHYVAVLEFIRNTVVAVAIVVIGIVLSKAVQRLIKKAGFCGLHPDGTVTLLLQGVIRYSILIISIIMALNIFGVNTASLLAVLGAAGIAVGLALKDALGNIAAGIIILFLKCYTKEEFIEFASFSGTVKEINLFTTILETPDGLYISAPNASIWGSPLKNYTRNGKRRMELSIGIAYTDSVDQAFQVMLDIIASEPRFLTEPAPQVIMQAIETNSVRIAVRAWAMVSDYWAIYWDLNKTIKAKIEAAGLHVPLPQHDIRVVQA